MLTPLDLNNKNFSKGFRGYDTEEVDEFFAKVAKDFERLYQDNVELKDAVERVSAKLEYYQQMESTMQNTLVIAQETADEVKKNSEQKDFDANSINAVKSSLMGPLAGIGDSIFWGVLRVIAAGIAVGLGMTGNILAPIVFLSLIHI